MITDPHEAFWFLHNHPKAVDRPVEGEATILDSAFIDNLDVMYVKVDPDKREITNTERDTQTEIWLETGPMEWNETLQNYLATHDPRLDCSGSTFDEALVNLANLVKEHYGEYTQES